MTTKEQERKALTQIKKIVESLGEMSYIGTALEGCLQDAEENIENDFACSMKSRFDEANAKVEVMQSNLKQAEELNGLLTKRAERAEAAAMSAELAQTISYDYERQIQAKRAELQEASESMLNMIGTVQNDSKELIDVLDRIGAIKRSIAHCEKVKAAVVAYIK